MGKNTLLIHFPQHFGFGYALYTLFSGESSFIWLGYTYIFWFVIGYVGFSIWYHRYFAHRAFKTSLFWENVWAYLGMLVGRGTPINLTSLHMSLHHPYADSEKDPHSPKFGIFRTWFLWFYIEKTPFKSSSVYIRHLVKNKFIRFLNEHYFKIYWITCFVLFLINWRLAFFCLFGAGVIQYHMEGAVSTFCHLNNFGVQDFDTGDDSRNIRGIFNILTFGTGLHNNHHAKPSQYHYELLPGDFDLARYIIPLFIKNENESVLNKSIKNNNSEYLYENKKT